MRFCLVLFALGALLHAAACVSSEQCEDGASGDAFCANVLTDGVCQQGYCVRASSVGTDGSVNASSSGSESNASSSGSAPPTSSSSSGDRFTSGGTSSGATGCFDASRAVSSDGSRVRTTNQCSRAALDHVWERCSPSADPQTCQEYVWSSRKTSCGACLFGGDGPLGDNDPFAALVLSPLGALRPAREVCVASLLAIPEVVDGGPLDAGITERFCRDEYPRRYSCAANACETCTSTARDECKLQALADGSACRYLSPSCQLFIDELAPDKVEDLCGAPDDTPYQQYIKVASKLCMSGAVYSGTE